MPARPVYRLIYMAFSLLVLLLKSSKASTGCVELDHITFDKVVKRFQYTLVKFDVAFPFGDKHEAFTALALELSGKVDDLLFALVGIKDYGEKENAALGQRFEISDKYPVIKLFNNRTLDTFVHYPENFTIDIDSLRKFITANSDLYIGLPGCLKEIDKLAIKFSHPSNDIQTLTTIVSEAESMEHMFTTEVDRKSFQMYITLMKKIIQSTRTVTEFIHSEKDRVHKLLKGKLSDNKRVDLKSRLNIMNAFKSVPEPSFKVGIDEL